MIYGTLKQHLIRQVIGNIGLKKSNNFILALYFNLIVNTKNLLFLSFLDPKKKNYMYCQIVRFEVLLLKIREFYGRKFQYSLR